MVSGIDHKELIHCPERRLTVFRSVGRLDFAPAPVPSLPGGE